MTVAGELGAGAEVDRGAIRGGRGGTGGIGDGGSGTSAAGGAARSVEPMLGGRLAVSLYDGRIVEWSVLLTRA